jgi:hypothetical protein
MLRVMAIEEPTLLDSGGGTVHQARHERTHLFGPVADKWRSQWPVAFVPAVGHAFVHRLHWRPVLVSTLQACTFDVKLSEVLPSGLVGELRRRIESLEVGQARGETPGAGVVGLVGCMAHRLLAACSARIERCPGLVLLAGATGRTL